jgi:hypothetical protein
MPASRKQPKKPTRKKPAPAPRQITIETWRGVPCFDFNNMFLFLARAPLDEATAAFVKTFKAKTWLKDVLGKEVPAKFPAWLVYQFKAHPWTVFDRFKLMGDSTSPQPDDALKLSKALKGKTMLYCTSDTASHYEYALFDSGQLIQRYRTSEGDLEFESADSRAKRPSQLREHFNEFMTSLDILIPPFGPASGWLYRPWDDPSPARLHIKQFEEFNPQNIPRVDLISRA